MRRPLGAIQPLDVPQPATDLLLLELLLRQPFALAARLELHVHPVLGLGVDRAAGDAGGRAADGAAAGPAVLEAVGAHGEVALVRDAAVGDVPLLWAERADELLVVGDHHDAAAVVADGDGEPAERVAVQVVGRLVEHEQVRVVPHRAREHHLDLLPARQARDLVVVGDLRVEADVFEVLRNDFGRELAEAEALAGGFVVVELLDELGEAEVEEGFARYLGVVLGEEVDPLSGEALVL